MKVNVFFVAKYSIPVLFLGLFFAQVFYTQASGDTSGLVACAGGDACNFCSFVDTTNAIIDWVIVVATTLTILLLAFAGFRLITSAGDASALEHAKKLLVNSFIGILIMLGGWTLVDTGLKLVAGGDLGVWNDIECGGAVPVAPATPFGVGLDVHEGFTIETDNEGQSTGYYFRAYTLNRTDNCKQLTTESLPDYGLCKALLDKVSASKSSYVVQDCDGRNVVTVPPSWNNLPVCGVPNSPQGKICYPGSGSGSVCFDAYPASQVVGQVSGYRYTGRSPSEFIYTPNPGTGKSMNTRISRNYSLSNFNRSGTCGQGGDPYMYISPNVVSKVEQVNQFLGAKVGINSAYRSPTCNARVSGAPASQHMQGTAVDLAPPNGRSGRCDVVRACRATGAGFIMTYNSTNHVHCDWGSSRGEKLTISCP